MSEKEEQINEIIKIEEPKEVKKVIVEKTVKPVVDVVIKPQLDAENCVPCQEKAFVEITDGICKDAEMNEGIEKGKCAIPLKRLSKNEITLPEYATEVKNLLPNEQKIAYDALLEVADEKGINVK